MMNISQLPIGVFDSGVGGLTVLRALQESLPQESFLYLGDTARLPYGTKTKETIITYTRQAVRVLLDRGIKMLVIACNTAATAGLTVLQESIVNLPIIGVLEPGAQAACQLSQNGHIAVIATEATVNSKGYQLAIKKINPNAVVIAQSCSLFVALAEEGWVDGGIVEAVAKRYLQPILKSDAAFNPACLAFSASNISKLGKDSEKRIISRIATSSSITNIVTLRISPKTPSILTLSFFYIYYFYITRI